MISSVSSMSSVSVLTGFGTDSAVGAAADEEERKKRAYVPSVEISAVQSMSMRVGDFLLSHTSNTSLNADRSTGAIGANGVDAALASGLPAAGLAAGPSSSGAQTSGDQRKDRGSQRPEQSLSSDKDADASSVASGAVRREMDEAQERAREARGGYSAPEDARPQRSAANTRYARQKNSNGPPAVRFDDIGTYRIFAAH